MEKFEIPRVEYRTPDLKVNFRIHRMYVHVQFNCYKSQARQIKIKCFTFLLVQIVQMNACVTGTSVG